MAIILLHLYGALSVLILVIDCMNKAIDSDKKGKMKKFKVIPNLDGRYSMNAEGKIVSFLGLKKEKVVKPVIKLKGVLVQLRKGKKYKLFLVRGLLNKMFGVPIFNEKKIVSFLDTVSWVRLLTKPQPEKNRICCKVLYQGLGVMGRDCFNIKSLFDAELIFNREGIFGNKWTPSHFVQRRPRRDKSIS